MYSDILYQNDQIFHKRRTTTYCGINPNQCTKIILVFDITGSLNHKENRFVKAMSGNEKKLTYEYMRSQFKLILIKISNHSTNYRIIYCRSFSALFRVECLLDCFI